MQYEEAIFMSSLRQSSDIFPSAQYGVISKWLGLFTNFIVGDIHTTSDSHVILLPSYTAGNQISFILT